MPRIESYYTWEGEASHGQDYWERVADEATLGVLTALPHEAKAVLAGFESLGRVSRKSGVFDVGRARGVGGMHHVLHVSTTTMGNTSAAVAATQLVERFPKLRALVMVGIAGMVPDSADASKHARLGDIVVSDLKGVVEYDLRKAGDGWEEVRVSPTRPGSELLGAVNRLKRSEAAARSERPWVERMLKISSVVSAARPPSSRDVLHDAADPARVLCHPRDVSRIPDLPRIHHAPIASSGTLLKDPKRRDELGRQFGVRAVEMEGAGIAEAAWAGGLGYLVIRGGCDYCDAHKNDRWQAYAAVAAARYFHALLAEMGVE